MRDITGEVGTEAASAAIIRNGLDAALGEERIYGGTLVSHMLTQLCALCRHRTLDLGGNAGEDR